MIWIKVLNRIVFGREFWRDPNKINIRQALKMWKILDFSDVKIRSIRLAIIFC